MKCYYIVVCNTTGFHGTEKYATFVEATRAALTRQQLTNKWWDVVKIETR